MAQHEFDELIADVRADLSVADCPQKETALSRLAKLRDYREHDLVAELAEKYVGHWPDAHDVMTFYAQAIIENGAALAAGGFLRSALKHADTDEEGKIELLALIGRSEKDLMQKALSRDDNLAAQVHAQMSFDAYRQAHEVKPEVTCYPLINMAAVADLARRNSVRLENDPDPIAIARQVSELLDETEKKTPGDTWIHATRAEAQIALGDWDAVEASLKLYLGTKLTPFQHEGTLRQFRDLWQLEERGQRGKAILAMLKARSLWTNRTSASDVWTAITTERAELSDIPESSLEKMLGDDGLRTYNWLIEGVTRAESVAAILTNTGRRIGTSFVISAQTVGLEQQAEGRACLMTNFHVLNKLGLSKGLSLQSGGKIRFEAARDHASRLTTHRVKDILFQSPLRGGLDCTIFTIDVAADTFEPIPLEHEFLPPPEEKPKPRFYIIGYPLGGEMQFSLQDNQLLDHECAQNARPIDAERRLVHYFAPTEPGNSGSPVLTTVGTASRCIMPGNATTHATRQEPASPD